MKKFLEGSQAIAEIVKLISPGVVCAYPITPQTHIVEELAKIKANEQVKFEYIKCESEFAAASIVLGASAAGTRTYTATSSQGLLLMTEVLFNMAGMRLPVVLTCANRAVSAPINIWNDQQDVMTVRDAGIILLFAENGQEAVNLHLLAYKVAEQVGLPVIVNVDGFVLTHTMEPVEIFDEQKISNFVGKYSPKNYLNTKNPICMGYVAFPDIYMEMRKDLHEDLQKSKQTISKVAQQFEKIFKFKQPGLIEYYGHKSPQTVIVAMGTVCSTIKHVLDNQLKKEKIGLLKIVSLRPFPENEILQCLKKVKNIAVLDKSISLGREGILASEIKAICHNKIKVNVTSVVAGLGGRDITEQMIVKISKTAEQKNDSPVYLSK